MLLKFNQHPFYSKTNVNTATGMYASSSRQQATANMGGGYRGSGANIDMYNPIYDRLDEGSIVEDWIPRDAAGLNQMFSLMYHRDPIAGSVVDIISDLIWDEFDLVGIDDPEIKKVYLDSMTNMNILAALPALTREFLVLGRSITSMIFDSHKGVFTDLISHDQSFVRITPIPILGYDPKLDLIPSPGLKRFLESTDPRDLDAKQAIPAGYIQAMTKGSAEGVPLDPISTLFMPRRVFNYDYIGTSLYTRLISFWALEKALINATMSAARRRSSPILHIKAGIENVWRPTDGELSEIAGLFLSADQDPVGAVVTTRNGVEASEVKSGTDLWKWSDEWQMLTEGKMRALGANDSLLCLAADTLIPTKEHGIIRLDTFGNDSCNRKLETVGRNGPDHTKKWLYSGYGKVVEVSTYLGNTLKCTPEHRILTLDNNDLVWKEAKDLKPGDQLCISKEKCVRESQLELNLKADGKLKYETVYKDVVKPIIMTTDLAYILGITVSEGCIDGYRLRISNTNPDILNGTKEKILKIFGNSLSVTIEPYYKKEGDLRTDKLGVDWYTRKQCYELCVWSKQLSSYLNQLGICLSAGKTSRKKVVPWSILEADKESQLAYLAAYTDGDGSIKLDGDFVIYSYSPTILSQTQIILNCHGIDSRVRETSVSTTCGNSYNLGIALSQYSLSGKFDRTREPVYPDREYGIVTTGIKKLLQDRHLRKSHNGSYYLNDDGEEVFLSFGKRGPTAWKHLLYRSFGTKRYDRFMSGIELISSSEHKKILNLIEKKYKFTEVEYVHEMEEMVHVYDIQMANDPSFVANGIIVHNSGEATYTNQESARSFLMEKSSALRDVITNRLFYKKLFPLIARLHGFVKDKNAIKSGAKPTQREILSIPESDLIIPTIRWRKDLVSFSNQTKIDMLEKMEEKGVPITIKNWASAGGVNLQDQMSEMDLDAEIRKRISEWKKVTTVEDFNPAAEAQRKFIDSLRATATAGIKKQLVGLKNELGALNKYPFWAKDGTFAGITAKEVNKVVASIDPSSNKPRILLDSLALRNWLVSEYRDPDKAAVAHYLLFRTGLTPLPPALEKNHIEGISKAIDTVAVEYVTQGASAIQMTEIVNTELKTIRSCDSTFKKQALNNLNETLAKIHTSSDKIKTTSNTLYSGF